MTTPRRTLTTFVAVAVLALAAVGCGVKIDDDVATGVVPAPSAAPDSTAPGDEPSDTTEAGSPDDTTEQPRAEGPADTTEPDEPTGTTEADTPDAPDAPTDVDEQVITAMVDQFTAMGLDEEQATCLSEKLYAEFGSGEDPSDADPSAYFEYFDACGISLSDLGGISGN